MPITAVNIAQRQLLRQTPAAFTPVIEVHFELVAQGHPLSQHPQILFGIALPQRRWKDVGRGFA